MFVGYIETAALRGNHLKASTRFSPHSVEMFNINLNGNSVNGYPLQIQNRIPTQCYQKFISCTNRLCNINGGKMLGPNEFQYNSTGLRVDSMELRLGSIDSKKMLSE